MYRPEAASRLVFYFFKCPSEFTEQFTYFFQLMRVRVGLIMLLHIFVIPAARKWSIIGNLD